MTACASSALSIADAAELVRSGDVPGMIAGGGDALCRMTYAGFHALRLLDHRPCRPFDASRRGLSLGEGAGVLVLERWDEALARGARPLAEYLSYGSSCDAHHTTAPHPEGHGAEAAMREALARAGLSPDRIDHIHAHGTGTTLNDRAEALAIRRVFGQGGSCRVAVTAGKSMTGHVLGGCGGLAAATVVLSLSHRMVPPTLRWRIGDDATALPIVAERARPLYGDYAMSNSFGFGGTNCSLVFGRVS
jgi:3-oxoacyl-[acyl-carrier-protein] synthase II